MTELRDSRAAAESLTLKSYRIAVLPGDGIGPEVMSAALTVLRALSGSEPQLGFDFVELPLGASAIGTHGDPLPEETIERAKQADGILHGATDAAAIPAGHTAPLSGLRRRLGTYVSIRPSRSLSGVAGIHDDVDLVVVREITEGTYSKVEVGLEDAVFTIRITSREATRRVALKAFEIAHARRRRLTAVHKLAGVPKGDALWLDVIDEVAADYSKVTVEHANVDAVAHDLVLAPQRFDVILAENLAGDILSDVAAAVTGGLPLAASGCLGDRWSFFEPVHGSAPDIAGKNIANPAGLLFASAMMLDHLGESRAAGCLHDAVLEALRRPDAATNDLGGGTTTSGFTGMVVDALGGR